MTLRATWHDNRGTSECPYGFVYFNDGRRVAYTYVAGVTDGTGGWPAITETHRSVAREHLKQAFDTTRWLSPL